MPDSKTPNPTHRKKLARALAAETGEPYTVALRRIAAAADAGRLPARLDDAGMAAALRILTAGDEQPVYEPGPDHRAVYELSPAELADALAETPPPRSAGPLNDDWQPVRRTASDPLDQQVWDLSYAYEKLTGRQGLVYISSPGGGADRYVFGGHHDVAGKGSVALGRAEALSHLTQAVNLARAEIHTRMAAIVATYGDGGAAEVDAPENPVKKPEKVTLVDMDAAWPPEINTEYVELLVRLNAVRRL